MIIITALLILNTMSLGFMIDVFARHNITSVVLSIISLSLMYIVPGLKRLEGALGLIGKVLFISTAMLTLISQAYAAAELPDENLIWWGVLLTLISSFIGHLMKDPDIDDSEARQENKQLSRFMCIIAGVATLLPWILRYVESDRMNDDAKAWFSTLLVFSTIAGVQYIIIALDDVLDIYGDEDYKTFSIDVFILTRIICMPICLALASAICGSTKHGIDTAMLCGYIVGIYGVHVAYPAIYKFEINKLMDM